MHRLFDGNWLIKAFQEVTTGDKTPSVDLPYRRTLRTLETGWRLGFRAPVRNRLAGQKPLVS
tara:strand:- start:2243 stop:2428 length:186 start_codon:yes stop_codon:yes gene_type:complete